MLEMKFILSIIYLISFLALANAADGAVSSSLRGSNHRNIDAPDDGRNYPTLEDETDVAPYQPHLLPGPDEYRPDLGPSQDPGAPDVAPYQPHLLPGPDEYRPDLGPSYDPDVVPLAKTVVAE